VFGIFIHCTKCMELGRICRFICSRASDFIPALQLVTLCFSFHQ
jgi:hypothetical protein